jgi:hypothetical protein
MLTVLSDVCCKHRPEPVPPHTNRLVANVDAALMEQILDLPQRQRETDVHHHRKPNDLGRRLEVVERIFHSMTLPGAHLQLKPSSSDNAFRGYAES